MEEKETRTEETLPPKITKEDLSPSFKDKRSIIMAWLKAVLYTMLSSLLVAIAAYSLIAPNEFTVGGASGVAILVNVATGGKVPQWIILFGINLPLVLFSFFFVKRRFAILSALNIGLQSLWLLLLEVLFHDFQIVFENDGVKIFAALAAGILIGVAVALAFKVGGSTGGADIIAVMIQKKFAATSIAWMIFIINFLIIGCSIFVFRSYNEDGSLHLALTLLPIMMSAFEAYIESRTNEAMTNGFQAAVEFKIITSKPEEMATALMRELSRGVTSIPATGMYTKITHSMLFCVVSKRQVGALRRVMKSVDPDSFAVMSKVSQVLGLGFYSSDM